MKEAKNVVVRLEGRAFVFEVDIAEEDLISEMISSLSLFIKRGFPIKVIQTSAPSMGRSQSMWTRILTSLKELGEWVDDLKRLAPHSSRQDLDTSTGEVSARDSVNRMIPATRRWAALSNHHLLLM